MDSQEPMQAHFMLLPPEVRNLIYEQLFKTCAGSIFIQENERAADHMITTNEPGISLLRACKTINREARQYATCKRLAFRTLIKRAGHEATEQLPKLGQQLTGSIFHAVETMTVGVTDLWRIIGSLGSLKTRMTQLKLIQAIVIKRMPYRYWKEKFPNIVSALTDSSPGDREHVSRACRADADRGCLPDLELARFRCHVRSHPLINEDEHYIDDDEDGYTEDRGNEFFLRSAGALTDRGLELHICARWFLVDRKAGNAVHLIVETTFDLATGQVLEAFLGKLPTKVDGDDMVLRSTDALVDIERRTVDELHTASV